jgi:hypothetical protein
MNKNRRTVLVKIFTLLAIFGLGLLSQPLLKADVIILQSGAVVTGTVLQQDADGVLIQMNTGTYRFPLASVRDVKKEAVADSHVSNNGRRIPDWAQIVSLLANTGWAQGLQQVPAPVIESGMWQNVPYISFRCRSGGYEVNIFGDLNYPAAVEIGAMSYLNQSDEAKSNCVNFICSVLANADDRKIVRALNWSQKDSMKNAGMTFETILPGEWGSYGGWWVSVYNENGLASAHASEAELLGLAQPRVAASAPVAAAATNVALPAAATPQPAATTAQPATAATAPGVVTTYGATYGTVPGWTAEELAAARPATPAAQPSSTGDKVYPRTYTRTDGAYGHVEPRRR